MIPSISIYLLTTYQAILHRRFLQGMCVTENDIVLVLVLLRVDVSPMTTMTKRAERACVCTYTYLRLEEQYSERER